MKRILYFTIAAVAASMILGCAREFEGEIAKTSYKTVSLTFEGGFGTTKTAFDEFDGTGYQLVWSADDAIGIFSYDLLETSNDNVRADILSTSVGSSNGIFVPEEEVVIVDEVETTVGIEYPETYDEQFLVYYPYDDDTAIDVDDACIHSTLEKNQTQSAISDKQVGKNGFSYALCSVTADEQKVNFTLQHTMAYICFNVSTTEYTDYQLHSIVLYDADETAVLSGDFAFDPSDGSVTPEDGYTNSSARVTVEDDDFSASTSSGQELYLTVFPGDYSSYDLKVVVTYISEDGTSVSIPMDLDADLNLEAATLSTVTISGVSSSSNTCAWYEPVEARELVNGYCYGPQNTYFAERKASSEGDTKVTIDVRGRGDFSKIKEPVYYSLICPGAIGRKFLMMPDGTTATELIPATKVNSDYTITVYVQAGVKGNWGVVGIYDEDYNVLWSYMINRYVTGDDPSSVEYSSYDFALLDRVLGMGGSFDYFENENSGTIDVNTCYFQWGRKDPFPFSNSSTTYYLQEAVTQDTDIAYAHAHPTLFLAGTSGTDDNGNAWTSSGDWQMEGNFKNLWGAVNESDTDLNTSLVGIKTIYDPCPEGYRAPDAKVLATVKASADSLAEGDDGNPFDYPVLRVSLGSGVYDYWPWFASKGNDADKLYNSSRTSAKAGYLYWSNSNSNTTRGGACMVGNEYSSSGWQEKTTASKGNGFSMRCQVDEYGK